MDLAVKIAAWADKLRDTSAYGLMFAENDYDRTRYRAIQDIAMEMFALASGETVEELEPIRGTVISRPTPFPVGDAAVIDDQGRILLMQRSDDHTWAMPGGGLEVGETPAAGVVREVFEETGVRCQAIALVGVFDSRLWGLVSRHHMYAYTVLCNPTGEIISNYTGEETLDTGWFAEDALPEDIHPGHAGRIPVAFRVWRGDGRSYFDP